MATSPVGCRLWLPPVSSGWCHLLPVSSGGEAGCVRHQLRRAGFVGHRRRRAGVFCYRFRREAVSSGAGSSADSFVWLVSPATSFIRCQFPRASVFSGQLHRGQVGSWQVRLHPDWTLVHRHLKRGMGKGCRVPEVHGVGAPMARRRCLAPRGHKAAVAWLATLLLPVSLPRYKGLVLKFALKTSRIGDFLRASRFLSRFDATAGSIAAFQPRSILSSSRPHKTGGKITFDCSS